MSKSNDEGRAAMGVHGEGETKVEENDGMPISIQKLPKLEVAPEDRVYVYVFSKFLVAWEAVKTLKPEVIMFVYMFAYVIRSVSSMTMIMHKSCRVNIGFEEEICDNLHLPMYEKQKLQVETMANNYHMYHSLIQLVPSIPLASFMGPWSDKYGRKPPIVAALVGIIIDGFGAILCAIFLDTGVQYYLVPALFTGMSGGFISVLTILYSYVSDTTTAKERTFRYTTMEIALGLGAPLGILSGGMLFKYGGYVPVFVTSLVGHSLGLLWVIYMLQETRGLQNYDSWEVKVRNFLSFERLKESFKAALKPRPHRGRLQLWLLVLAMSVCILGTMGTANIAYIYTFHHYDWTNTKYSTVSSVFSIMGLVVMLISVPVLVRILKLGDPTLGIIGNISIILKNALISLSYVEGGYYFANLCGMLSGLASLAGRSRISKVVPKEDLGKAFAFLSTVEALVPVFALAVVTQVFNNTVGTYPDPTYMGMAVLVVGGLAVYIWMACLPRVNYDEEATPEEEKQDIPGSEQELSCQA